MSERRVLELAQQLTQLADRAAAAERRLADSRRRTRNLLANVRSIASHTAEHADDVADFVAHFEGRLGALARCHSMLLRSGGRGVDLEDLLREELLSHALDQSPQIIMRGDGVRLGPHKAEVIALALHELTANALMHGALSSADGALTISWRARNGDLEIDWVEQQRDGLGRALIGYGLPYGIGAVTSLEIAPTGLHCRILSGINEDAEDAIHAA